ncbi:MAG TPA: hypothetical protein VGJ26_02070 [Pirellulales bacterium]|jgi:hypothetical protein
MNDSANDTLTDQPKPGWLLIVSAGLVLAQSAVWFGGALSLASVYPAMLIPAAIAMVGSLMVAFAQYNALFRRRSRSAFRLSLALGLSSLPWVSLLALSLFIAAIAGSEAIDSWPALGLSGISAVLTSLLVTAAVQNERWGNLLVAAQKAGAPTPARTFTLRDLFAMTTILAAMLAVASWFSRNQIWESLANWGPE